MRLELALIGLVTLATLSCQSAPTSPRALLPCASSGTAATVTATDAFSFTDPAVTITVGQSVCWQNTGSQAHTVTDVATAGRRFDGNLPAAQSFIHTFGFGGSFEYRCTRHATMTGTVIVNCRPGELSC